jgi:hypothetical protein
MTTSSRDQFSENSGRGTLALALKEMRVVRSPAGNERVETVHWTGKMKNPY